MDFRNNHTECRESREIDLDGMHIADVAEYLHEIAEGLEDCTLAIETEYSYGDSYLRQSVRGWRPATDQEIALDKAERKKAVAQQRHSEEMQAERLRKARPDLFQ
jgi:hypothetical protein